MDMRDETMKAVVALVNAAEDVAAVYNMHLRGKEFASKELRHLRDALAKQKAALVQLRGPDHDPHDWTIDWARGHKDPSQEVSDDHPPM